MCRCDVQGPTGSLEEIYGYLRKINSLLWRQLRTGALSRCHALLYTGVLHELGQEFGWRDVNRKAIAALHRFTTVETVYERMATLQDALKWVGQKVAIAKRVALQTADTLVRDEREAILAHEAELLGLCRLLTSLSPSLHSRRGEEGSSEILLA